MSEALLLALIQFAVRFGIPAALEFFKNRGTTIDEALAALEKAHTKTLDDYLSEAAAAKLKSFTPPPAP